MVVLSAEELAVRVIEDEFLRYLSRCPIGYKNKPSGDLSPFLAGRNELDELNREYDGQGVVYVGKAIENLFETGRISFFQGNYVLEDLSVMKVDKDVRSKKREGRKKGKKEDKGEGSS